jgi:hypothetical protein
MMREEDEMVAQAAQMSMHDGGGDVSVSVGGNDAAAAAAAAAGGKGKKGKKGKKITLMSTSNRRTA